MWLIRASVKEKIAVRIMKKMIVSFIILTALFAAFTHFQTIVSSQTKTPFTIDKILGSLIAIKKKQATFQKIIDDIKIQGVDFPLTAENEKRLRKKGATNKLIEAIRQHSPEILINLIQPTAEMIRKNSIEMELVYIPPGEFMMGSSDAEIEEAFTDCKNYYKQCEGRRFGSETPKHKIIIKDGFWMGKYEVTQEQWQKVMDKNPSLPDCGAKCPVNRVSWDDVQGFLTELNAKNNGFEYTLPSEAEWEYAARAGTTTIFAFGNILTPKQANFDARSPSATPIGYEYIGKTVAVSSYIPNAFGLYDMHGNVWEWCQDIYSNYEYTPTDGSANMKNPNSNPHVARGGSYDSYGVNVRSAQRYPVKPDEERSINIGFRVVARVKLTEPSK